MMASTVRPEPMGADAVAQKRDFRQEVTDRIVRMLEEGVAPWQKPWEPSASCPYEIFRAARRSGKRAARIRL